MFPISCLNCEQVIDKIKAVPKKAYASRIRLLVYVIISYVFIFLIGKVHGSYLSSECKV